MRTNPRGFHAQPWTAIGALCLLLPTGCGRQQAEVRGRPPSGPVIAVANLATAPAKGTVTVRGTMVEK